MIQLYTIVTNDEYEFPIKSDIRIKEVAEFFGTSTNSARGMVCRPRKKLKYKIIRSRKVKYNRRAYEKRYRMTHDRAEYFKEYRKRRMEVLQNGEQNNRFLFAKQ